MWQERTCLTRTSIFLDRQVAITFTTHRISIFRAIHHSEPVLEKTEIDSIAFSKFYLFAVTETIISVTPWNIRP